MIKQITGDIFKQKEIQIIFQIINCFCTQKSGLAAQIKEKFPQVAQDDIDFGRKGDKDKLGSYLITKIKDSHLKYIVSIFGQFEFGTGKRFGSYDSIVKALEDIRDKMLSKGTNNLTIGIPYKFASDRAGCAWSVIEAIIYDVFEEYPFQVLICKLPEKD